MPRAYWAATLETDATRAAAVGRLLTLLRAVNASADALRTAIEAVARRHNLASSQLVALWVCRETPSGIGQTDLATRVGVSAAQASAVLEQLRRRGLLVCERAATDRRRQVWSLTAAGVDAFTTVLGDLVELADRCDGALAADEQRVVCDRLAALAAAKNARGTAAALRLMSPEDDSAEGLP